MYKRNTFGAILPSTPESFRGIETEFIKDILETVKMNL